MSNKYRINPKISAIIIGGSASNCGGKMQKSKPHTKIKKRKVQSEKRKTET